MAYEVLARKWRPQQFDEVVGQEHVVRTLKNAITSRRIAHAYLFVGPRGIGKTSLARILAKALNCAHGPTPTPCDQCDSCREISAGSHLDVIEIDGASNNKVDEVRVLRDNVRYAPARGPFKIYIIDEVHMLSIGAFNALLKTLEEPPEHVKFILATTEPQKIPATVLSRCQRFDLRRIPLAASVERLTAIAKAEKVDIDSNALLAVARGAEGSLRDAECALDQLISFRGNRIVEEDVLSVFGLVARQTLEGLAEAILKGDVVRLLQLVAELDAAGKDMQRLVVDLLDHLRNVLVCLCTDGDLEALEITEGQAQAVKAHAALTSAEHLLRITDVLLEAESRLRYALSKRTLIETLLLRCARAASVVSLDSIVRQVQALAGGSSAAPVVERKASAAYPVLRPDRPSAAEASVSQPTPAKVAENPPPAAANELDVLAGRWREVAERVGALATLAKGALNDARPLRIEGDVVVVGFEREFSAEAKRMEAPRARKALQVAIGDILRRPVSVELCVAPEAGFAPPEAPAAPPAAAAGGAGAGAKSKRSRREWLQDPSVQKTLEMFNGRIVDIRE